MDVAQKALQRGHIAKVVELLDRHQPEADDENPRGFEWYYLWGACQRSIMARTLDDGGLVTDIVYSPDSKTLTTVNRTGTVRWRDATTFAVLDEKKT